MMEMDTQANIWSLLDQYDEINNEVAISRTRDGLRVIVYKVLAVNLPFGIRLSRRKKIIKWDIDNGSLVNPAFKDDINVNCAEYMAYAEKGFNENPTNVLSVLEGVNIPDQAKESLEEYNYRIDLLHTAVGLASEAGEILDHINKYVNHNKPLDRSAIASEFGDIEWYKFNALRLLGISFSDTLKANVIKLNARYPEGRTKNYLVNQAGKDIDKENNLIKKELYKEG
jgi:NTP pyrophosphatase (non-canonical NTP hydrolase)